MSDRTEKQNPADMLTPVGLNSRNARWILSQLERHEVQFEDYMIDPLWQATVDAEQLQAELARLRAVLATARTAAESYNWTACRDALRDAAGAK